MTSQRAAHLVKQLEAVADIQARIDLVADDYKSKRRKFAVIDAWTLGELLDIDFESAGDGHRTYLGYRRDLADSGLKCPFAENVRLLRGLVPKTRYAELDAQAEAIVSASRARDLRLTARERKVLEEAYAKEYSSSEGVSIAFATVRSSGGVKLDFEVVFDADGPIEAYSPYDEGFDTSGYIELE